MEVVATIASGSYHFLDEPFAGLNPEITGALELAIRAVAADGASILVTDHFSSERSPLYQRVFDWVAPISQSADVVDGKGEALTELIRHIKVPEERAADWQIERFAIGDSTLLRDVAIILPRGSLLVITGGNGSGKSTLLRAMAKVRQPWSGVVFEANSSATGPPAHLSPQPPKLVSDLSISENLYFMIGRTNKGPMAHVEIAAALLNWLGVRQRLSARAEVLSGGEAALVALVGASLSQAPCLLLDEPIESLTHSARRKALQLIAAVCAAGKRVVATTQNTALLALIDERNVLPIAPGATLSGRWSGGRPNAGQESFQGGPQ